MEEAIKKIEESSRNLKERQDALLNEYQSHSKHLIGEVFGEFLKKYPQFHALYWTQFKPHFNDGEACVFGVKDLCVILTDDVSDEDDIEYACEHSLAYCIRYQEDLEKAYSLLPEYEEWEKDKQQYAKSKMYTSITQWEIDSYKRNHVVATDEEIKAAIIEERAKKWSPYYKYRSAEEVRAGIEKLEKIAAEYPDLGKEGKVLIAAFNGIDSTAMEALYGDGVMVIVKLSEDKKTAEVMVEEYYHD